MNRARRRRAGRRVRARIARARARDTNILVAFLQATFNDNFSELTRQHVINHLNPETTHGYNEDSQDTLINQPLSPAPADNTASSGSQPPPPTVDYETHYISSPSSAIDEYNLGSPPVANSASSSPPLTDECSYISPPSPEPTSFDLHSSSSSPPLADEYSFIPSPPPLNYIGDDPEYHTDSNSFPPSYRPPGYYSPPPSYDSLYLPPEHLPIRHPSPPPPYYPPAHCLPQSWSEHLYRQGPIPAPLPYPTQPSTPDDDIEIIEL